VSACTDLTPRPTLDPIILLLRFGSARQIGGHASHAEAGVCFSVPIAVSTWRLTIMRIAIAVIGATMACQALSVKADEGLPSKEVIAEMGLSGMQIMSDSEAYQIRGSGFVSDWGRSKIHFSKSFVFKLKLLVFKLERHIKQLERKFHFPKPHPRPNPKPWSGKMHKSGGFGW
jgi:hypothetical protein